MSSLDLFIRLCFALNVMAAVTVSYILRAHPENPDWWVGFFLFAVLVILIPWGFVLIWGRKSK